MNRRLTVAAVVAAVLAIVGVGWAVQSQRDTTGQSAPVPTVSVTTSGADVAPADTYGLGVGDPKAPVKIEVFEDFLCPFCREYEETGRSELRAAAQDGKAYVVYRPIAFLDEYSARAMNAFAVVMEKSGPEVALKFHDLLYDEQPAEGGTMPTDQWLVSQAVAAGANAADIQAGIDGFDFKQWIINANDAASKRHVNGTPTVFVNGAALQGISVADLVHKTETAIENGGS